MNTSILKACFLGLLLSGCATSSKVFTDFDSQQNFNAYKTFAWMSDQPALVSGNYPVPALAQSRIGYAIKAELQNKGFEYVVEREKADFLVSFTLGARDKIKTVTETEYRVDPSAWRWGSVYYPYYYPTVRPVITERPYQFTEGSIAIDIFDNSGKRPVWHSSATKRLSKKQLQGSEEAGQAAAKALLENFPPSSNQ